MEIPNDIKRSIDRRPNILNEPIKVLILCQDSRTCSQLNQYLLQGGERHLFYQAVRNDLVVSKLSEKFEMVKESDADAVRIENAAIYKSKVCDRKFYLVAVWNLELHVIIFSKNLQSI